jgi:hypothetical protein
MLADAGAPAVLALTALSVMFADAGAPAVLAGASLAVMLAHAGAPAVFALAPSLRSPAASASPCPTERMLRVVPNRNSSLESGVQLLDIFHVHSEPDFWTSSRPQKRICNKGTAGLH